MGVLVDTNILLRWTLPNHSLNALAAESVARLVGSMNVHRVREILTLSPDDFTRCTTDVIHPIQVLHPSSAV
jgi:hypothetical protein